MVRQQWEDASLSERIVLLSAVLGLLSPFFPWYYLCTRVPGMYDCTRWNGFQMDNDIFGLFVFVTAAVAVLSVLWPRLGRSWTFIYAPGQVQLISGIVLLAIAFLRLISFRGESSSTIGIGPNVGLVFVMVSGIGILAGKEADRILGFVGNWRGDTGSRADGPSHPEDGYDFDIDDELDELLDIGADPDDAEKPKS